MKKLSLFLSILSCLYSCSSNLETSQQNKIKESENDKIIKLRSYRRIKSIETKSQFNEFISANDKALIFCFSSSCSFCKMLKSYIFELPTRFNEISIAYLDIEDFEEDTENYNEYSETYLEDLPNAIKDKDHHIALGFQKAQQIGEHKIKGPEELLRFILENF